jgi:GNAT superfamily N-acetyltransferase
VALQLRAAVAEDEASVLGVIRAALESYHRWSGGWVAPADLDEHERVRWRSRDPAKWLVALLGMRVVGVCRWVEGESPTLSLLMVEPGSWGAGVGSALHARALASMAASGARSARLTVPEGNLRARCFYERNEWCRTATPVRLHEWLDLPMVEYARLL